MKKILRTVAIVLAVVLVIGAAAVGIWYVTDPYKGRIAPGVSLGGLEIGGMTRREARQALKTHASALTLPVTLLLPEEKITLEPEELGVKLDVSAALRAAWQVGRGEEELPRQIGLLPYLTLDTQAIRSRLEDYARRYDTTLTQSTFSLAGETPDLSTETAMDTIACQTLEITLGLPEAYLDVDAALTLVESQYDLAYGMSQDFAGPVSVPLEMTVTAQPDDPDLVAIAGEICQEPTDDSLNMETYSFQYGSYGYTFDRDAAQTALSQAGYGETVTIPMTLSAPEITGDAVYFRDVLGSCQTKHNTNENRNNNLRLLSQALDGYILQPGEEFSYNAVVGERTAERGYLPAPAYSGSRLTDSVGGGVCQGSSTLYNCVLLADLEVTNRVCHGASINYLPLGLDAAVNWGTTDFCFKNNWNFPIKIRAWVTDEYLEMEILGTDEKDYYIELQAYSWKEDSVTWASSYQLKYDKETGELRSKDKIGYSTYYDLG